MIRSRNTKGIVAGALLLVAILALAASPVTATDLTYSGQKIVITQPGTYVLKNDISNSDHLICVEIAASNVVFDGGGHLIDGVKKEGSAGIYVHGPSAAISGVTIKNVRVKDWYYGIYIHETSSSVIEGATLSGNSFTGVVFFKNAVGNRIMGSTITGNQYGVIFSDGASGGIVTNNEIKGNELGLYLYLSDGATISGNQISQNLNTGIHLRVSGNGKIYNNHLNNNFNVKFGGEPFKANSWSVTPGTSLWSPANIMGGPRVGGNFWGRPSGDGFSQTEADSNDDGFIDSSLMIDDNNVDNYPLALYSGPTPSTTPTVTTTTAAPNQQTPYQSVTVPARIEAENYDNGGEGVAYHDVEPANLGIAGRVNEGVDVETAGGVTNVAYIRTGEWIEYTINVPAAGTYPTTFRVSSPNSGRTMGISVDGTPVATIPVPNTGSFTTYTNVVFPVALQSGTHTLKVTFQGDGQNFDWFEFGSAQISPTATTPATTTVIPTASVTQQAGQTPYNGPHTLPGTIQAEDFDNGGQNVAYWDSTVENKAKTADTAYRPSEYVDAETLDGVSNLAWVTNGEWTEYTVEVAASGAYTANFRVGSWANGRQVVLSVDGAPGCTITVPNTGSYTAYQTVSAPLSLPGGTHVIRLTFKGDGMNVDWFSVTGGPSPTSTTIATGSVTATVTQSTTTTVNPTVTTTPAGGQSPYRTHSVPVKIQAEDFDNGGEGVAYHDTTPENLGKASRLDQGVDLDPGGVVHIGYVQTGEWVEYTVNVPSGGTYPTSFRVGSWYPELGTRSIEFSVGGVPKGTVIVPITGSDTSYQVVTIPLALDAGTQSIRLTFKGARQNLDWFEIQSATTTIVPTGSTPATTTVIPTASVTQQAGQTPYNGPHTLPGTVQAEDFDNGGQNVAYWDSTVENKAKTADTAYRPSEYVDAETLDGVSNLAWVTNGEWTEYTVEVAASGAYTANFRVGSWANGRQVVLSVDGAPGCTITVPNTGSYTAYQTVSAPLSLPGGMHVIRLTFKGDGINVDWFSVTGGPSPTSTTIATGTTSHTTTATVTATATTTATTVTTTPDSAPPVRIEAEMFDEGQSGVAYRDYNPVNNVVNLGNWKNRDPTGVDLYSAGGVVYIGSIESFEWLHYTLTVPQEGDYTVSLRACSWGTSTNPYPENPSYDYQNRKIQLRVGTQTYPDYIVPNTGNSALFQTDSLSQKVHLTAGTHQIGIMFLGQNQNFDWMEFSLT